MWSKEYTSLVDCEARLALLWGLLLLVLAARLGLADKSFAFLVLTDLDVFLGTKTLDCCLFVLADVPKPLPLPVLPLLLP